MAELPDRRRRPLSSRSTLGVVGLGYWGPNLLRVLLERPDADVRWICEKDSRRLDEFAGRYPSVRATERLDDLLDDPELDGVVLATPVHTHYDLAQRCLEAGKHTFVEKPLAISSEHALALVDFATRAGLTLMCGHTFLYSPPVRRIKQMIDSGELGNLYFVSSSRVNLGIHQRDVSVVWDLGPHDFSILLYWLGGPPKTIRATGRDSIVPGVVDVAFVTMEYESGLIANVELSWLAPSKLRRTVIVASKKMVVYQDGDLAEAIKIYDRGIEYKDPESFGEYHLSYRTGDITSPHLSSEEPLSTMMWDFLRGVSTGALPDYGLALASDVVRLAEATDASLAAGGDQIELGQAHDLRLPH
jgi:predicted dehydrogenase